MAADINPGEMMSTQTVSVPMYDARNDNRFGPAMIEHRTAGSGLSQLGSYFMVYDAEDPSDPWTVQYEETIYVIEGQSRLVIITGDTEQEVIGNPGDLIAIPKGTTLRYGALLGTRLLLSISPVNWREPS